jgi:hypothetical protein
MDDPLQGPTNDSHEETQGDSHAAAPGDLNDAPQQNSAAEISSPIPESIPEPISERSVADSPAGQTADLLTAPLSSAVEMPAADAPSEEIALPSFAYVGAESPQRRNLRNNLFTLLGLSLASFVLTAWVLVRVESPFGLFASGPREVANAQLRAIDRGEMRASYDMFSEQYRRQVTFDQWRQLVVTHWRLFHAEVLSAEPPEQSGQRVTLEIHLRGADEKPYRARFTLIRAQGRWWVDDLHWADEPDERDLRSI